MSNVLPLKISIGEVQQVGSTDTIPTNNLGTGTANSTTFLRGDQTWSTLSLTGSTGDLISFSSTNTISNIAAVTAGSLLGSNGTTTLPTWVTAATLTTSLTTPLLLGGTGVGSLLELRSTSGTGTTTSTAIKFTGGTNGATVLGSFANNGQFYLSTNTSSTTFALMGNTSNTQLNAPTSTINFQVAGSTIAQLTTTNFQLNNNNLKLLTAGNGIYVKEGTNATMGRNTLVSGAATISTTKVTSASEIFISDAGGGVLANAGALYEDRSSRVVGTSFIVKSLNVLDTSNFCWIIIEPS